MPLPAIRARYVIPVAVAVCGLAVGVTNAAGQRPTTMDSVPPTAFVPITPAPVELGRSSDPGNVATAPTPTPIPPDLPPQIVGTPGIDAATPGSEAASPSPRRVAVQRPAPVPRPHVIRIPGPAPVVVVRPKVVERSSTGWINDPNVSFYGPGFYGHRTACGLALTPSLIGVANRTLPCGTMIRFRNPQNGRVVVAPVVDRGPYVAGRQWDLTGGLCMALGHCWTGPLQYARA